VAVRWRDTAGAVGFLSEAEAPAVLRTAAREAAARPIPARAWRYPLSLAVEAKRSGVAEGAAQRAVAQLETTRTDLGSEATLIQPVVRGKSIGWTANDGQAAYVSLVAVAANVVPPNHGEAWAVVTRGYEAYRAGRDDEALVHYRRALALDPTDRETFCRVGSVHLAMGAPADALAAFGEGLAYLDEMDGPMRAVCRLGFAQTLERSGRVDEAAATWQLVLEEPDVNGSHAKSREALGRVAAAQGAAGSEFGR
jgi:tetratricopeptide (TPR) repeat protein